VFFFHAARNFTPSEVYSVAGVAYSVNYIVLYFLYKLFFFLLYIDFVVTDDYSKAFRNADYLLFMFNSNAESKDDLQQLKPVVEKVSKVCVRSNWCPRNRV